MNEQRKPTYEELFTEEERKNFYEYFVLPVLGENATPEQIQKAHYLQGVLININTQFALDSTISFHQSMESGVKFLNPIQFVQYMSEKLPPFRKQLEAMYMNAKKNQEFLSKMLGDDKG